MGRMACEIITENIVTNHKSYRVLNAPALGVIILCIGINGIARAAPPADPQDALVLLEKVATQMVTALRDPSGRGDVARLESLVDENLVPHINFRASSNLVLGKHWKTTSEIDRVAFIEEFRSFLVRFYTQALSGYVKTREIPQDLMVFDDKLRTKGGNQVLVTSRVKQPNGGDVNVVYRLLWANGWKVVDVSLGGISMVKNYQSSFASTVEKEGIQGLIAQLRARNENVKAL